MLVRDPLIKRITAVLAKLESYLNFLSAQNLNDVPFDETLSAYILFEGPIPR